MPGPVARLVWSVAAFCSHGQGTGTETLLFSPPDSPYICPSPLPGVLLKRADTVLGEKPVAIAGSALVPAFLL